MERLRSARADALDIFKAALIAADPAEAVRADLRDPPLDLGFRRIYVAGAGKAGATMALAAEEILGARITAGAIAVKDGHLGSMKYVKLIECGHPVPDQRGQEAAREIAGLAAQATEGDLFLFLLSGGASALMPFPAQPVTLEDKQETTRLLLASGANIHEINTVRKHLSSIKGGWLAALAWPATVVSLILSDVIGDDLDVIGSGPTAPDSSTFSGALAALQRYGLLNRVPDRVRERLESGAAGCIPETPNADHPAFQRTHNVIVGGNAQALTAAAARAGELGYHPLVLSSVIEGETREIAKMHTAIAREVVSFDRPVQAPCCLISGGETTVTLQGGGKGGRNQEFVLAAALEIAGNPRITVLSGGTDGTDGPTDAAGAICDGETVERASLAGNDAASFLSDNDSYHFFEQLGDLVKTGPTGTNVADVRILIVSK